MLYLLDANVLIGANRDYYPVDRVPEFWKWLLHLGETGRIKMPVEIHEEVERGNDILSQWIRQPDNKRRLILNRIADRHLVNRAVTEGYAHDLSDEEIEKVGRDTFALARELDFRTERYQGHIGDGSLFTG